MKRTCQLTITFCIAFAALAHIKTSRRCIYSRDGCQFWGADLLLPEDRQAC
jgi:hypothetical protein